MSTQDVPGANPANRDQLAAGCWAEHADGSLLFVKGNEGGSVVYELYDLQHQPIVYYQDAMAEDGFKVNFSFPPAGKSKEKWTWHDKKPFPWKRVMRSLDRPAPQHADVNDTLSAAAKVAQSLALRARKVTEEDVEGQGETVRKKDRTLMERIEAALAAFSE